MNMMIVSDNCKFIDYIEEMLNKLSIHINYIKPCDYNGEEIHYLILSKKDLLKQKDFKCKYCFLNMDIKIHTKVKILGDVITFGLGNKNTVTVSSIEDDDLGFVYCLQRTLNGKFSREIHPQEIPMQIQVKDDYELYANIINITIALLEGMEGEDVLKKLCR